MPATPCQSPLGALGHSAIHLARQQCPLPMSRHSQCAAHYKDQPHSTCFSNLRKSLTRASCIAKYSRRDDDEWPGFEEAQREESESDDDQYENYARTLSLDENVLVMLLAAGTPVLLLGFPYALTHPFQLLVVALPVAALLSPPFRALLQQALLQLVQSAAPPTPSSRKQQRWSRQPAYAPEEDWGWGEGEESDGEEGEQGSHGGVRLLPKPGEGVARESKCGALYTKTAVSVEELKRRGVLVEQRMGGQVRRPRRERVRGGAVARRELPLFLRLLIGVFPFLRFWGGFL